MLFPTRDDNPQINVPYATYGLIVLNVLTWLVVQGAGSEIVLQSSVCEFGFIPAALSDVSENTGLCQQFASSGGLGLFSSMFMHGGWMHLIGNMWFLWIFGDNVEDAMGSLAFLVFYIATGVCAAFAQYLSDPSSTIPMVGASGAIGGVMGAYIMLYPKVKVHLLFMLFFRFRAPAVAMLGFWVILQVVGSFNAIGSTQGGTAFMAHLGGFMSGVLLVNLFKDDELLDKHPYHGW